MRTDSDIAEKAKIIDMGYKVFSNFHRPTQFTNSNHCPECAEHDETMRSIQRRQIGFEQVGNPAWSPIAFLTDQAYGYVMPRLLELALTEPEHEDCGSLLFPYLLALTPNSEHRDLEYFDLRQSTVLLQSLTYIKRQMSHVVERECCEDDLDEAITKWTYIVERKGAAV